MSSLAIVIEVSIAMIVVIGVAAYWTFKEERAKKSGLPKPRRRIQ